MERTEKALDLIEAAQKNGIRLECTCGIVIVRECGAGNETKRQAIMDGLRKYLREVRSLVEARSRADAGSKLVGQPIWVEEYGEGTLLDASSEGVATILVGGPRGLRQMQLRVPAESLLILANKVDLDAPTTQIGDQPEEKPAHRGILNRLRG